MLCMLFPSRCVSSGLPASVPQAAQDAQSAMEEALATGREEVHKVGCKQRVARA